MDDYKEDNIKIKMPVFEGGKFHAERMNLKELVPDEKIYENIKQIQQLQKQHPCTKQNNIMNFCHKPIFNSEVNMKFVDDIKTNEGYSLLNFHKRMDTSETALFRILFNMNSIKTKKYGKNGTG